MTDIAPTDMDSEELDRRREHAAKVFRARYDPNNEFAAGKDIELTPREVVDLISNALGMPQLLATIRTQAAELAEARRERDEAREELDGANAEAKTLAHLTRSSDAGYMAQIDLVEQRALAAEAVLKAAQERERKSLRPITMQDVRLRAGEGRLAAADVLAAANAELVARQALSPAEPQS